MSIYIYRLSQWIEKKFNAKGGNVITDMEQVARTVVPLPVGNEDRYLQGWNRFCVVATQPAVAAQNSRIRIRNPVNSNVIVVLEQLTAGTTTAGNEAPFVTYGAAVGDLASLITLTFTRVDPRGNPQPTAIVSTQTQVGTVGQALLQRTMLSFTSVDFITNTNTELPILPGNVVDINNINVNTQLIASLMWRERSLETSELT